MPFKPLPDVEILNRLFSYDEETGLLHWKFKRPPYIRKGDAAGARQTNGYLRVSVHQDYFAVHRVIFKMIHNSEPEEVDHINGVKDDNRISNLRASNKALNTLNRKTKTRGNLPQGITMTRQGKFMARACVNYRQFSLGTYERLEDAQAARTAYVEERLAMGV